MLNLISILKQQFTRYITGKYETSKHQNSNILLF